MADAPGRIWANGLGCYGEADMGGTEYIRADVARTDAELAVAEAIRRAADEADKHYANGDMGNPGHWIRALAPADALAEVQRLRAERDALVHDNARFVEIATIETNRAEKAEAERDAALARVEKLREAGLGLKSIVEGIQGAMEHGTWRAERSNLRMKDTDEWVTFYNVLAALDEDARHG